MKPPILQLEQFLLTRLQIDYTFPDSSPAISVDSVDCSFDYDVASHAQEPRRRMMRLRVAFQEVDEKKQNIGYTIQCDMTGFFTFTESTPKDKEEFIIRVNGFNMLYGALRGVLATTTAVFLGGRFSIPNVMPNEIVEDVERRREQASQQTTATQNAPANPTGGGQS